MALVTFCFVSLVAAYACGGKPIRDHGNFPLDGCSTDVIDLICLYFDNEIYDADLSAAKYLCTHLFQDLRRLPSNKTTPRVLFAGIIDRFSNTNESVDVSSWRLLRTSLLDPYWTAGLKATRRQYKTKVIIENKVTFLQRLFSEMVGVRGNATKIAVLFLDGAGLLYDEIRSIPEIVQQQGTDIKIFVVVMGVDFVSETTLLNDTLLVSHDTNMLFKRTLSLVICAQCMEGWWSLSHSNISNSLSCYKLVNTDTKADRDSFQSLCDHNGGLLVSIESEQELNFIRQKMILYLSDLDNGKVGSGDNLQSSAQVYIGLQRDSLSVTSRFKWSWAHPSLQRPLVVNNRKPGKPSGGYSSSCVVWQFVWAGHATGSNNLSEAKDIFSEGWTDVECRKELNSFGLCEVAYPPRIESTNFNKINPAKKDSFSKALAKGDFVEFEGNIVSVSASIASADFVEFFKLSKQELFPLFDCGHDAENPRFIAYVYVCDSVDHCSNRRDESACYHEKEVSFYTRHPVEATTKCFGVICCDGSCLPLMFVNDGEVDCAVCDYRTRNEINDESVVLNKYLKRNKTCAFICNLKDCVHFYQLNDGEVDCYELDGPIDETVGKLETSDTCYNLLGHAVWAPRCVYVRDMYGAVMGCRDMSHVKSCSEFVCPEGYFKCPNTYCIPQHYVLDRQVDCPRGEDEQLGNIEDCTGNFACWDSKMCLHPDLVCDEHPDCPHGDDEVDCGVSCTEGFRCVSGTVTVSDYNRSNPLKNLDFLDGRIKYIDLSNFDLSLVMKYVRYIATQALRMKLSNCRITSLPEMLGYFSRWIQELDVSYNLIQTLDGGETEFITLYNIRLMNLSFNRELVDVKNFQFKTLEYLDLSHTGLARLDDSVVAGFPNLKYLDLSFTYIADLRSITFPAKRSLQTLNLRGLTVNRFYEDVFNGLTISHDLYTDSFQLCCSQIRGGNIPEHACHAPDNAISSCFDLVGLNVQRVLLWMVAVIAVLGNMTVIVYRIIWDRSVLRTGYGLFVTNLGISDFIMGVYLFIIAGADYYYRGVYVLFDKSWRESALCKLAGLLTTLSSETSIIFIFLVTLDRYLVMKFPFGQIKFSQGNKIVALIVSWIVGFLLSLSPILFEFEMYSSNVMCLGLPLTTKRLKGWKFSFGVFVVHNLLLSLGIACGQRAIFRAMSGNRMTGSTSSTTTRGREDIIVAKQLSLVALSNFLCWFPIGLLCFLSLGGYEINNEVYSWTTVIVLPINSAANPLLYTIPALLAKWEKFKQGAKRTRRRSI